MKKSISIVALALLAACGSQEEKTNVDTVLKSGDLNNIKAFRSELMTQEKGIKANIAKLDAYIEKNTPNQKLALVATIPTKETAFEHHIEIQGTVNTKQNVVLYPEFNGVIKNIVKQEGAYVKKGEAIAKIDDAGLKEQLAQAQSGLALAKTTFERQSRLWKQNIGSEIQYLQAKTQFETQSKMVEQIKAQLDKTIISAPFSGVIDDIITEQGSFAAAGQTPVARLVNLNNMTIKANVPELYVNQVRKGKHVKAYFPVLGQTIDSHISLAGNFINPASRNFQIEVPVKGDINAKPNMTVRLQIADYSNNNAILIPQNVLGEDASNKKFVFVLNKKTKPYTAEQIFVETGKTEGDLVEIISGLKADQQLITEGSKMIRNGQKVKLIQ